MTSGQTSRKRSKAESSVRPPSKGEEITAQLVLVAKALAVDATPKLNQRFMALTFELLRLNEVPYKAGQQIQKHGYLFSPHEIPYDSICRSFSSNGKPLKGTSKGADLAIQLDAFLQDFVFERFDLVQTVLKPFSYGSEPDNEAHLDWLMKNVLQVITTTLAPGFLEVKPEHALNSTPAQKRGRVEILCRNTLGAAIGIVVEVKTSFGSDFSKVFGQGLAEMALVLAMNASELATLEVQYLVLVDRTNVRIIEVTYTRQVTLVWSSTTDIWPTPPNRPLSYDDELHPEDYDSWRPIANAFAAMTVRILEGTCSAFASRSEFRFQQDEEEDSDGTVSSASPLSNFASDPENLSTVWAGELKTAQEALTKASLKITRWKQYYTQSKESGRLLSDHPSSDCDLATPATPATPERRKGRKSASQWAEAAQRYSSIRSGEKGTSHTFHAELNDGFHAIPFSAKKAALEHEGRDEGKRNHTKTIVKGSAQKRDRSRERGVNGKAKKKKKDREDSDGTATATRNAVAGPSRQR